MLGLRLELTIPAQTASLSVCPDSHTSLSRICQAVRSWQCLRARYRPIFMVSGGCPDPIRIHYWQECYNL